MGEGSRWIVGLVAAIAIILLVLFATGEPGRGRGDGTQSAAIGIARNA